MALMGVNSKLSCVGLNRVKGLYYLFASLNGIHIILITSVIR